MRLAVFLDLLGPRHGISRGAHAIHYDFLVLSRRIDEQVISAAHGITEDD
jgi:hypothetical protein